MSQICFRCGGCRALIKAPVELRNLTRSCPGCGQVLVIRMQRLQDEGPALVGIDTGIAEKIIKRSA
jgi:hypothetical protein